MKRKIVLLYLILIIIGVALAGMFSSQLARNIYKNELENNLINSAVVIGDAIINMTQSGVQIDYNQLADNYSKILSKTQKSLSKNIISNIRVTIIDFDGTVIGESNTDCEEMENHFNRKEIQQAITEGTGTDIRFSNTLKINSLYSAAAVNDVGIVVRLSVPLVQLNNIFKTIIFYTLIGAVAGIVLTTMIALTLSHYITRPINQMISAAKHISNGNYSKRIDITTKDEIGQLTLTFNHMTQKLETTISELKDKNVKVDTIINSMNNGLIAVDRQLKVIMINTIILDMFGITSDTDAIGMNLLQVIRNHTVNNTLIDTMMNNNPNIKDIVFYNDNTKKVYRLYTSLIKSVKSDIANEGAIAFINDITDIRKLEDMRTEFVSNITHELKTPLTSIRGFVETLRHGALQDEKVAENFLEIIDIEAERLFNLINDILQLSEIESMQNDKNIVKINICDVIKDTVEILKGSAQKKQINVNINFDENIYIKANRNRIKQLFINLIDNAIKYNYAGGSVFIDCYTTMGQAIIKIKDTGIGIPLENQSRIFERFYRVDKGRSRSIGGTGLGLSIVKHIVNLYDGDITFTSIPQQETEFIIKFPKG